MKYRYFAAVTTISLAACNSGNPLPAAPATSAPVVSSAPSGSHDLRAAYDLSEKCGRDAREWFQHFFGDGHSHTTDFWTSSYTNHYNAKLNRCFAVVSTLGTVRDEKTKKMKSDDDRRLVDINENNDVGTYFKFSDMALPMQCYFGERHCASQAEWEAIVVPYMDQ